MPPARFPALVLAAAIALGAGAATAQAPPDETWRTLETAHFRITFPEPLEALAERAGTAAERAHQALSAPVGGFRAGPAGTVDVVLTD